MTDAGRQAALRRLAGPGGVIAGIALDHRDSLRVILERHGLPSPSIDQLRELKLRLARALAPVASAVMLDEELGGFALDAGAVPANVGLIMPLEAQGYEELVDGPTTTLLPDFSPVKAAARGASACKLLLPYRADAGEAAERQEALVLETATTCHAAGLPLVVEPIVWRRPEETAQSFAAGYAGLVAAAVDRLRLLGVDLFKTPFPVLVPEGSPASSSPEIPEPAAAAACRALDDACGGIPWVLLGAGAPLETFLIQIRIAGGAGAAGFLGGRGIWGPALVADPVESERIARETCRSDLERCRATAERFARPLATT